MKMFAEVKGKDKTLDQQLQQEQRVCPQCRYTLTNPFSERCPRCLTFVPVNDPGCSKCVHQSGCPVAHISK